MLTGTVLPEGDAVGASATAPARAQARGRVRRIASWIAKATLGFVVTIMILVGAVGLLLDTDLGHRLILDRVAAIAPDSGLRIRIGRIGGSIWGRTQLRDVRLYDPDGLFAEAPQMELDWQPLAWLWSRLVIHEATSELIIVHRAPKLLDDDESTLPRQDLHIGRLEIAQLRFEEAVAGTRRVARVEGEVEYRRGRFLLDLDATMRGGGDRLALLIDAAPDRDELDLDLALDAPADGVLAKLLGSDRPLRVKASGEGSWRHWAGTGLFEIDGRSSGELRLSAASGLYRATGWLAPAPLLSGRMAELAAPRTMVSAEGRLDEGVLAGRFAARSSAMRIAAAGAADLRRDRYRDVSIAFELLGAGPFRDLIGPGTTASAVVNGPFADASLAYRASIPRLVVGSTALMGVTASGSGRWSQNGLSLPLNARVRSVDGPASALLSGLRVDGSLRVADGRVRGEALRFSALGARGRFGLQLDLETARYALAGTASADAFPVAGLGPADLSIDFRTDSSASFSGTARGRVRRIDNDALAWAAGGPLTIESRISGEAGTLRLPGLRLAAPRLQLAGTGEVARDGALRFEGSGRQASLGPLAMRLAGDAARPRIGLRLARPSRSLGLTQVNLDIEPAARGYAYRARGGSPLGPFSARGTIAAAAGRSALLNVAALNLSGATASGVLRPGGDAVTGTLDFRGSLTGPLTFARTAGGGQHVEAHLVATDARLGTIPIGSGRFDAAVDMNGEAIAGQLRFSGAADRPWSAAGIDAVRLSGPLALEAAIAGTVSRPDINGSLRISGGRLVGSAAGTQIENVEAQGRFNGLRLQLERISGRTEGGGRIGGSGEIGFGGSVDLRLQADSALLVDRAGMRARVSGPVRIRSGEAGGGNVSGDLRLSGARLRFGGGGGPDAAGGGAAGGSRWSLALRLRGERIEVDGRGLDSRWSSDLRVGGTIASPALFGEATLVDGTYTVLGRPIELSRGTMRFDGETPPDPRLDIVTRAPGGLTPAIRITGRASRPEIGVAGPLGSLPAPPAQSPARREALRARRSRLSSNNTYRIRRGSGSSPSASALPI